MMAGDTIQCHDLEDALEVHEQLCKEGWDVEFEYKKGSKVVLVLKGKVEECF